MKQLVGHMGGPDGPAIQRDALYSGPRDQAGAGIGGPSSLARGRQLRAAGRGPATNAVPAGAAAPVVAAATRRRTPQRLPLRRPSKPPRCPPCARWPAHRPIDRGRIGYASLAKGDIETDIEGATLNPNVNIARKLGLAPGQTAPAADEWGAIAAGPGA